MSLFIESYHAMLNIFRAQTGLVMILSPELIIVEATDAYIRETRAQRDDIVGKNVFKIFPDNPNLEDSSSMSLRNSIEIVFATGKAHQMDIFRYDIPDWHQPGKFYERYWLTTNTPVFDELGNIEWIIHETINVTDTEIAKQQLEISKNRERTAIAGELLQKFRLGRLFEQAPAAMAIVEGPEFIFSDINSVYAQLFPGKRLVGNRLFDVFPELKGQYVEEIITRVYETGETYEGKEVLIPVSRYTGQASEDIYWNFIYQAIFNSYGKVIGVLIFALDVTEFVLTRRDLELKANELKLLNLELEARVEQRTSELHLAQADVEKQKQHLEDLFNKAPAAIVILSGPDFVFQFVNPIYQLVYPGRDLINKPLLTALPELVGTAVPDLLKNVYETGKPFEAQEFPLFLTKGIDQKPKERYWNFVYLPRKSAEGTIDGILAYGHEVTDQVLARRAIEASEQRLGLVTDALPVLISYIDTNIKYRFVNKAYESWFHVRKEDLIDKYVFEVIGSNAYNLIQEYMVKVLAGNSVDFEATLPYINSKTRHVRISYVPDLHNNIVRGFYSLVTDISQQFEARISLEKSEQAALHLAQELKLANEQLVHSNIDLDNFKYAASHDLKGPISNLELLLHELLEELSVNVDQKADISTILILMRGAIDRLKRTISSLADNIKSQQQKAEEIAFININKIINDTLLDLGPIIKLSGGFIEAKLQDELQINLPEKHIRSIIYNLLLNAIKYKHPSRELIVTISCYEVNNQIILSVKDNGLGLTSEQKEKLFTMFKRFHSHIDGSGIGLFMIKRIVVNAGGKIEVQSKQNEGTTFTVTLIKSDN